MGNLAIVAIVALLANTICLRNQFNSQMTFGVPFHKLKVFSRRKLFFAMTSLYINYILC